MELATTSSTRWCRPRAPVSPMYMAGPLAHGLDVAEDADLSGVVALRRGALLRPAADSGGVRSGAASGFCGSVIAFLCRH